MLTPVGVASPATPSSVRAASCVAVGVVLWVWVPVIVVAIAIVAVVTVRLRWVVSVWWARAVGAGTVLTGVAVVGSLISSCSPASSSSLVVGPGRCGGLTTALGVFSSSNGFDKFFDGLFKVRVLTVKIVGHQVKPVVGCGAVEGVQCQYREVIYFSFFHCCVYKVIVVFHCLFIFVVLADVHGCCLKCRDYKPC